MLIAEKACLCHARRAVSDLWREREKGAGTHRVRCLGWGVTRPVAWYIADEGVGEGKRLEWRIGTGIYTQGNDDRAEIG